MGCSSCSIIKNKNYIRDSLQGNASRRGCTSGGCGKLSTYSWFPDNHVGGEGHVFPWIEVRFKNTRKDFFYNPTGLPLKVGDIVCVEGQPGVDVGMVSLIGLLVLRQMKKLNMIMGNKEERKSVLRIARQSDINRWQLAIQREKEALNVARIKVAEHGLDFKITDVEFQGDGTKAIIYFYSDDRVDFRELVKNIAASLQVRIEMKQIGARQEAGLVGGIGSCGREFCCSTWLRDFRTVNTTAVRYQQLSINPQKLAGQCGKLKCCLNYELDMYLEAFQNIPARDTNLQFKEGEAKPIKINIFKKLITYRCSWDPVKFITIPAELSEKFMQANQRGEKPEAPETTSEPVLEFSNFQDTFEVVDTDSFLDSDPEIINQKSHMLTRNKPKRPKK